MFYNIVNRMKFRLFLFQLELYQRLIKKNLVHFIAACFTKWVCMTAHEEYVFLSFEIQFLNIKRIASISYVETVMYSGYHGYSQDFFAQEFYVTAKIGYEHSGINELLLNIYTYCNFYEHVYV